MDTTLTVIAGSIYRLLARSLKRYEHATPETIHEQFIDTTGHIDVEKDAVVVTLKRRTWTPVLLQAGFAELDLPIPWWGGRHLRSGFPEIGRPHPAARDLMTILGAKIEVSVIYLLTG